MPDESGTIPVHREPWAGQGLPPTLTWDERDGGVLRLLDQTLLPHRVEFRLCRTADDVWHAIRVLCVRGAPAIGVAAAYGLCLAARPLTHLRRPEFLAHLRAAADYLSTARPTAVNLSWALRRMLAHAEHLSGADGAALVPGLLAEAHGIARQDAEVCRRIGQIGESLIPDSAGVLTHCNAGALATVAHGTALALLYEAHRQGRSFRVFADETRPLLQGARLTAFELAASGINVTVLCDGAAASLMQAGRIQLVVVGADRIAANGDTANKIGTLALAVAARQFSIPFYVVAPLSTLDLSLASGRDIPIEQRAEDELRQVGGIDIMSAAIKCYNPAFDVTPAGLITALVTETGIARPVNARTIAHLVAAAATSDTRS
jgi:methylthioribose-1-phosphate isomerase